MGVAVHRPKKPMAARTGILQSMFDVVDGVVRVRAAVVVWSDMKKRERETHNSASPAFILYHFPGDPDYSGFLDQKLGR